MRWKSWAGSVGCVVAWLATSAGAHASCAAIDGTWYLFALSGKPAEANETVTKCTLAVTPSGSFLGPCAKYKSGSATKTSFATTGVLHLSACSLTGSFKDTSNNVLHTIQGGQLSGNSGSGIATNTKGFVFLFNLVKK
jgi:hypothetical protein